jgi:hypothetical protein
VSYPRKKARSRVGQIVARYRVRPATEYNQIDPNKRHRKHTIYLLAHLAQKQCLDANQRPSPAAACKVGRQELATQS